MAKYFGEIGFVETVETSPGIWTEEVQVRSYYGDVLNNSRRLQNSQGVNDNLSINMRISILADPYAYKSFHAIRYATYLGTKWKVDSVEVERPRLTLNLGGVYNGEQN